MFGGMMSMLFMLSRFFVLGWLMMVVELWWFVIWNEMCVGKFVLMMFVSMLVDGCCVVIIRCRLVVCVICVRWVM